MSAVSNVVNGREHTSIALEALQRLHIYHDMDTERNNLIQVMIQHLDSNEKRIADLELDLQDQKDSRATYQSKAKGLEEDMNRLMQRISNGAFVAVLIDGDGAKFRNEFLRDHERGGAMAAWKLKEEVKEAVKSLGFGHDIPVQVRVYANVNDLAKWLRLSGAIDMDESLQIFTEHFTNSYADFDFVNIGKGKENADSKIRRYLDHYHRDVHCRKIFVACCHDNGYLHDLRQYAGSLDNKITLIETTPAEPGFRTLGFPIRSFDSVFRSEPLSNEYKRGVLSQALPFMSRPNIQVAPGPIGRPIQAALINPKSVSPEPQTHRRSTPSASSLAASPVLITSAATTPAATVVTTASAASINTTERLQSASSPQEKPQAPFAGPVRSASNVISSGNGGTSISYATAGGTTDHQNVTVKIAKPKKQPRYAYYNDSQGRLDPPTQHPPRTQAQTTYQNKFQSIKPLVFCNDHYLKGRCKRGVNCDKEHELELTPAELAIHRYKARTSLCPQGPHCADFDCYLSHHCPRPTCNRNDQCPFYNTASFGDLHYTKDQMVPRTKWTEGVNFPEYVS